MKSIGIDIGTTTVCIVLVNLPDGMLVQAITLSNDSFLPTAHPWERIQNPAVILARVFPALEEILAAHSDIAAIGLTGQMHGIIYLDEGGLAVSPLYTWQDGRGNLSDYENGKSVCGFLDQGLWREAGHRLWASDASLSSEKGVRPDGSGLPVYYSRLCGHGVDRAQYASAPHQPGGQPGAV